MRVRTQILESWIGGNIISNIVQRAFIERSSQSFQRLFSVPEKSAS